MNKSFNNKEISSQDFIKNGWRLIDKYKDESNYYAKI